MPGVDDEGTLPLDEGTLAFDRDELTCIVHFAEERTIDCEVVLASDADRTAVWVKR